MNEWKNKPLNLAIFIAVLLLFLGCSPKVLSIFFDGVPGVVKVEKITNKDLLSSTDTVRSINPTAKIVNAQPCIHRPYEDKICGQCHSEDKRILLPQPELCYQCHQDFSKKYQVLHGPAASGYCTKCHNQHQSNSEYLLIRTGQDLCLYCHNTGQIFKNKNHKDIGKSYCTQCHNPHGGENNNFLRENFSRK